MESDGVDARARLGADELRSRHQRLLMRLRAAAEANGHDPDRLRILAVTKGWPVEVAATALEAGLSMLGESRVQEAEAKVTALPAAEWHLVGRLQTNKARRAARAFAAIHSIDSVRLLERVAGIAHDEARQLRLLLEVNVTGERTKAGFAADELPAVAPLLADRGVVGLMTIARMGAEPDEARATFRALRALRDRLEQAAGIGLPELSMGMSDDADAAAAEGATIVRIGTALFGPRP